jgi:aspartyl-tRNA(Asn)/glutamyl-tRNA(Gln) amidotransferase subunit A
MSILNINAYELVEDISNGSISAEDFTARMLERISKYDERINAYITINNNALDRAREIDKEVKSSNGKIRSKILLGVPIAIKDNISTKGIRTTCASKVLEDYIPVYDATVVSRIKAYGAIIIGKTNMDEFGMGSSTEFSAFGVTRNPWDTTRVAGGSSGGSAAALAASEAVLALGSDTGGSVRCPASFCSVLALKPTYGLLSRYGLISYANSLECVGLMARSAKDLALLLTATAGYDRYDDTSININNNIDYYSNLDNVNSFNGMKAAVIKDIVDNCNYEVKKAFYDSLDILKDLGFIIEEIHLKSVKYALPAYYVIAMAEASSNLARYDGIRYGYTMQPDGMAWNTFYSMVRSMFGDEVKKRIMLGTYILSSGYYGKYYMKAQIARALVRDELLRVFKDHSIIAIPTMPIPPFKIGERIDDPLKLYTVDICTILANLAGIPALSIPCAIHNGLPIGLQLMAKHLDEQLLLSVAHKFESIRYVKRCID